jgi:hypothetical protein
VCGSVSCPDLRTSAFTPDELDVQLDEQVEKWLQNDKKGLAAHTGLFKVSRIFFWYQQDFGNVAEFISLNCPAALAQYVTSGTNTSYFEYNWNLNGF